MTEIVSRNEHHMRRKKPDQCAPSQKWDSTKGAKVIAAPHRRQKSQCRTNTIRAGVRRLKKHYMVTNWLEYNEALRRRGDITIWFIEEALVARRLAKTGARARPQE
jgi:hypothetical protein